MPDGSQISMGDPLSESGILDLSRSKNVSKLEANNSKINAYRPKCIGLYTIYVLLHVYI